MAGSLAAPTSSPHHDGMPESLGAVVGPAVLSVAWVIWACVITDLMDRARTADGELSTWTWRLAAPVLVAWSWIVLVPLAFMAPSSWTAWIDWLSWLPVLLLGAASLMAQRERRRTRIRAGDAKP